MRCSKCGADNREGRKFCTQCGSALAAKCSRCGAAIEPAEKFCGECGAALGTSAATGKSNEPQIRIAETSPPENLEGERKTVTTLFADIKGSMELIEDLDPEEARAIIDPALKLMMEAVQHYGGYVAQSTGDGIFALFGAPVAQEDHPQRALYAALRMQEELRRYSDQLRGQGRSPLSIRVGVNTGEVVVRTITTGEGHTEYVPIGHSTSLASRLQALGAPGSITISDTVTKLVEGYFALKALGPARIKGVSEPVHISEVTGIGPLRTRLQRAAGQGFTKFVGREPEMEALGHAAELARAGDGQIVAAMAEPGVGKSRLVFEFKARNQSGWTVLEAFSVSHGKASAYMPVLDFLHGYFKIAGEDDERTRREKVAGRLSALDPSLEDTRPYLFSLLGILEGTDPLAQMDGQLKKRRTLEAIKRILLRESLKQPLMLIFEDLHWIDEQTQEFLNLLVDSIANARILLLVNYRPEYSHQWGSKTFYTQLRLDPLGQESAEEMLSTLLGDGAELIPLKRLIIEKTEGTPFFMEETVQVLFDEGALVRNGAVHLTKALAELKIPPTVQAILASRIDRLPSDAKDLLQTLAVIGREFSLSLIRAVIPKSEDELKRRLDDLQMGEFIYERPAVGDTEYVFKHALTQEVAYNSVLIERRKQIHEVVGRALESMFAGQLDDHLDQLANHYSRGTDPVKAIEYLGRAGQQALRRSAYTVSINRFSEAIHLLQKMPESSERNQRELLLQLALAAAFAIKGGWGLPEVEGAYARAKELCEQLGDRPEFFPALSGLWAIRALRGELPSAYALAEQLLHRAQASDDSPLLMYAHYALGFTSFWMGEFLTARKHLETASKLYSFPEHRSLIHLYGVDAGVHSLSYAAWTLWHLGYPDQAIERGNDAVDLARRVSHPESLTFALCSLAAAHQSRREPAQTQANAESAIDLAAEYGLMEVWPIVTSLRGWTMAARGCHAEGIAQIQETLIAGTTMGSNLAIPYILLLLVDAYKEAGRLEQMQSTLTQAFASVHERDAHSHGAEMIRLKGELLLAENSTNAKQAEQSFLSAIAISRKQNAKSWELRATTSLARLLRDTNRRDEVRAMLSEIYNWFTEGFDTVDLKEAKALLDELKS